MDNVETTEEKEASKAEEVSKEEKAEAVSEKSDKAQGQKDKKQKKPELKEVKKEEIDYKAKFLYLAAELDNLKKRHQRERDNLLKFGNEDLLLDLIEVVDNFERTENALRVDEDEKTKNILVGIDMIRKQFLDVLSKHGLNPVEALGKDFDPNFHEALTKEKCEGKRELEVIKEFQKGYLLNERLVRAAKVVVATNPDEKVEDKKEEQNKPKDNKEKEEE